MQTILVLNALLIIVNLFKMFIFILDLVFFFFYLFINQLSVFPTLGDGGSFTGDVFAV